MSQQQPAAPSPNSSAKAPEVSSSVAVEAKNPEQDASATFTVTAAATGAAGAGGAAADAASLPPIQMFIYEKDTMADFMGPFNQADFKAERVHKIEGVRSKSSFSTSGHMFALALDTSVCVYDANTFEVLVQINDLPNVRTVKLSPKGTYLQTFTAFTKDVPENLIIWHLPTAKAVAKFTQRLEPDTEIIQWTQDETIMCKLGSNELHLYDGSNIAAGVARKIAFPGLKSFQVSPISDPPKKGGATATAAAAAAAAAAASPEEEKVVSKPNLSYVALFSPPTSGRPGLITIHNLNTLDRTAARVTGFKVTDCLFHWNATGTAILAHTSTDVAEEGNYYGESQVFFLTYDGRQDATLTFGTNPGPVQDVRWCPRTYTFATLQGEARNAKAVIWGAKDLKPLKELGSGPWNTIRFSPSGRFVALAGVGNLAGHIEIWDKTKLLRLGAFQDRDSPRVLEFTPCGRYFYTATIFPHLRVGNQMKIWTYYGKLLYQERFEQLRECIARPVTYGVYPERPPSPDILKKAQEEATAPPPAPVSRTYVPPHLRNAANSGSYSAAPAAGIGAGGAQRSAPRDLTKVNKQSAAAAGQPQQQQPPQYYSPAEQMMRSYQEQLRKSGGGRK